MREPCSSRCPQGECAGCTFARAHLDRSTEHDVQRDSRVMRCVWFVIAVVYVAAAVCGLRGCAA